MSRRLVIVMFVCLTYIVKFKKFKFIRVFAYTDLDAETVPGVREYVNVKKVYPGICLLYNLY